MRYSALSAHKKVWALVALAAALLSVLVIRPNATSAQPPTPPASAALAAEATSELDLPAFGSIFHAMWQDYTDAMRIEVLDRLAAANVRWLRIDMGWSSFLYRCSTCWEQWYIDRANMVVNEALARGMRVLVTLWRTPDWANGGRGVYAPPTDPADYGRIAYWAANHFRGRVSAWEIWNEPNLDSFWTGSIRDYVNIVRASYHQFKAGDPNATVVAGSTVYNDTGWLEQAYGYGLHGHFDAMATHPYQGPTNLPPEVPDTTGENIWLISHVEAYHEMMAEHGDGDKPIWFTEFGWSSHENYPGLENWELGVTEQQQADYLVRAVTFVGANYPYVSHMFWYDERNDASGNIQVDNYGLMDRSLNLKPVYFRMRDFLRGCTIVGTHGNDVLRGTRGNDMICGRGGDDRIFAGKGDDIVYGRLGHDGLHGGDGHDTLFGGVGQDRMYGGSGADLLVGADDRDGNDLTDGGSGADICVADDGDERTSC